MRKHSRIALVAGFAVVPLAFASVTARVGAHAGAARADLHNAAGDDVGSVKFIQKGGKVTVRVSGVFPDGLAPGFKGFHVHAVGDCTPPFTSAGGHFNPGGGTHRDHAGDMPPLLVNADGTASATFATDRVTVEGLAGKAVIVHMERDNLANIPARYHSHDAALNPSDSMGPDSASLATGDAGGRYACGVIAAAD